MLTTAHTTQPGDMLEYNIQIENVAAMISAKLGSFSEHVQGTLAYSCPQGKVVIPDDAYGTGFPLDGDGKKHPFAL